MIVKLRFRPLTESIVCGAMIEENCPGDFGSDVQAEEIDEEPRNIILGMISQVSIGMDLSKISFPTFVLEPRSLLERITDFMSHQDIILG